jgi:hypothetical protein
MFQRELYNGIPNVTVWRTIYSSLSAKGFVTLTARHFWNDIVKPFLKRPALPAHLKGQK